MRQFGFDIAGTGFTYEAGDALGVWARNCPDLVSEICGVLGLSSDAPVSLNKAGDMPLSQALTDHLDITGLTRGFLTTLARQSPDADFAPLLDPARKPDLDRWLWGRQVADVLHDTRPALEAQDLVGLLRPMQPRLYSISSSPRAESGEVQLTVSVLRYACDGRARKGLASAFLADRCDGTDVRIFPQPSAHFHPPEDGARDIIMVGPGTGIAPFRGFLHDRRASGATGRNWLVFGEQHAASDFYYRDELQAWRDSGHLTRLDLAFSRDQAEKVYVQTRIEEQGAELWNWLQGGAAFYVCGDASRMARDVDMALKRVIARHGDMTPDEASVYVHRLQQEKRYGRDVY
ncbi:hypothetical protein PE067_13510 [Paracoccus sp. DMF-8]|uniref:diflavin oxidoreductase n=1 Tax=Paracoccus sp. DMF-8 TaxID=3019445 RepID=UPI0023E7C056|nr:hypothetical protein [Paracoccus sp. DMF-8]MDF3607060.1 hypothetical protein [Paracoccus sp. DMF-8]